MISGSVGKAVDCITDHEARCWGSNPRRGTFPFCLYLLLSKSQSGQQTNSDSSFPSWNTIGTEIEIKLLLNCLWREYRLNFQLKIVKNNVPLYTVPARWIFEFNAVAIANMAGNETWLRSFSYSEIKTNLSLHQNTKGNFPRVLKVQKYNVIHESSNNIKWRSDF